MIESFENRVKTEYLKGKKLEELVSDLKSKGVDVVVDVRSSVWMPIYYKPTQFKNGLGCFGIGYMRFYALGNPSVLRKRAEKEAKRKVKIEKEDLHPLSTQDFRFTQNDVEQFERENDKKSIWGGKTTKSFSRWVSIDFELMDKLAKKYYLEHLKQNETSLKQLLKLIFETENVFCLVCECPTLNEGRCHRFWVRERLVSMYEREKKNGGKGGLKIK